MEKKVIVFIVEGVSEEAAIGPVMKEYFSGIHVQFAVVHGDITTRDYVSTDHIVRKINELVGLIKRRYRYTDSDIIRVIHIADTDGVFVEDGCVRPADVDAIVYHEDHMDTGLVDATRERNHRKADILFKLHRTGRIGSAPYRIYYNSCNLEQVLYKELKDFSNEEKEELSDAFAETYERDIDGFIRLITDQDVAVPGTYQETWKYIEKDLNSLHRHTNMNQIFERT